jgi:hypothetical protein
MRFRFVPKNMLLLTPCQFCRGKRGNGAGFCPCTFIFCSQCHSTDATYLFIYQRRKITLTIDNVVRKSFFIPCFISKLVNSSVSNSDLNFTSTDMWYILQFRLLRRVMSLKQNEKFDRPTGRSSFMLGLYRR